MQCKNQAPFAKVVKMDNWKSLIPELEKKSLESDWIYRGQLAKDRLQTTLERACEHAKDLKVNMKNGRKTRLKPSNTPEIEEMLIREFRRWYDGENRELVRGNTLFCLSLMQHFGAPTRLLDWTYSPYVALYFAVQYAYDKYSVDTHKKPLEPFALWCMDSYWCFYAAGEIAKNKDKEKTITKSRVKLVKKRRVDKERQGEHDKSFDELYMPNAKERLKFVLPENPFYFNERLYVQRGTFVCPGDISVSFEDNLQNLLSNCDNKLEIIKYCCRWDKDELYKALEELLRMNIYRAALFPGLNGFGTSMKYRLPFWLYLHIGLEKAKKL